jgi:hypothetical protein
MKAIASLATVMLLLAGVGLVACGDDDEDGTTEVKPFRTQVQALRRAANEWAPSFAAKGCTFEAQGPSPGHLPRGSEELCARLRPLSAAFQKSFADATVEDIKFKGVEAPPNRDPIPRSQRPPSTERLSSSRMARWSCSSGEGRRCDPGAQERAIGSSRTRIRIAGSSKAARRGSRSRSF